MSHASLRDWDPVRGGLVWILVDGAAWGKGVFFKFEVPFAAQQGPVNRTRISEPNLKISPLWELS